MRAILELIDLAVGLAHLWKKRLLFPTKVGTISKTWCTRCICLETRAGLWPPTPVPIEMPTVPWRVVATMSGILLHLVRRTQV